VIHGTIAATGRPPIISGYGSTAREGDVLEHFFTASGTLVVARPGSSGLRVDVIGSGGSGGADRGGGGGGGGIRQGTISAAGSYPVVVGQTPFGSAERGNESYVTGSGIPSAGYGGAGAYSQNPGGPGTGCGGGAGINAGTASYAGGSGDQGGQGGQSDVSGDSDRATGGGGGMAPQNGGNGSAGVPYGGAGARILRLDGGYMQAGRYYCAGGGGGHQGSDRPGPGAGAGGSSGAGGNGGNGDNVGGGAATTPGSGGGGGGASGSGNGGSPGQGLVIVSYIA
jgi:Glycine-rich domain